jgi:hypothetical protein
MYCLFIVFKYRFNSNIFVFIFISTTHIIKFSTYLCSKFYFLSFRPIFCFTNLDYRLIRMTSPPINPEWWGFTVLLILKLKITSLHRIHVSLVSKAKPYLSFRLRQQLRGGNRLVWSISRIMAIQGNPKNRSQGHTTVPYGLTSRLNPSVHTGAMASVYNLHLLRRMY